MVQGAHDTLISDTLARTRTWCCAGSDTEQV